MSTIDYVSEENISICESFDSLSEESQYYDSIENDIRQFKILRKMCRNQYSYF